MTKFRLKFSAKATIFCRFTIVNLLFLQRGTQNAVSKRPLQKLVVGGFDKCQEDETKEDDLQSPFFMI